jgi:hypothetical protein
VAQIAGVPRSPLFALEWVAPGLPMLAIGLGRAVALVGRWPRARLMAGLAALVLVLAAADQTARVRPVPRVDVTPAVHYVAEHARAGDTVVYAPSAARDLVNHDVHGARVVGLHRADGDRLAASDGRVFVLGAFGLGDDATRRDTLALVDQLAAARPLDDQVERGDIKVWRFG